MIEFARRAIFAGTGLDIKGAVGRPRSCQARTPHTDVRTRKRTSTPTHVSLAKQSPQHIYNTCVSTTHLQHNTFTTHVSLAKQSPQAPAKPEGTQPPQAPGERARRNVTQGLNGRAHRQERLVRNGLCR